MAAGNPQRFSIDGLATPAGVTPRTVRRCIAQDLLGCPEGDKRGTHHLKRRLEQLLLVRGRAAARLSLEGIRAPRVGGPEDPPPRPAQVRQHARELQTRYRLLREGRWEEVH